MRLKNLVALAAVILTAGTLAYGQKVPTFAQYAVKQEKIRNINVNLRSHKDARTFRTNLRNAAKSGVNFAGHYILTGWGCGTNCSQWAIIDARSGRVFFPKELAGVGSGFCELPQNALPKDTPELADDASGFVFSKANSKLLVLTGFTGGGLNDQQSKCGNYFFEWDGTTLRRVKFVTGTRSDTP